MNIKEIAVKTGTKVTRALGKTGLRIRKYSPEILVVAGTASVITGFVLGCKATLKAEEVLDKHADEMDVINEALENGDAEYTEMDIRRDKAVVYCHTVGRFAKLYAPGVGFTVLGIGCYLASYGVMKKRNVALMAAYKTLEMAFGDYRKRVIDELGEDYDKAFRYGGDLHAEKPVIKNEDGTETVCEGIVLPGGKTPSMYARFFDETSTQWTRSADTNRMNLHNWQNWANDLLDSRGYLFLNEVYNMLGFEVCKEGQAVGWVKNNPRGGDNYVDFGMFNVYRGMSDEPMRRFHNGYEKSILLDFNVDGVIWDLI